jgi:hypothetical protein
METGFYWGAVKNLLTGEPAGEFEPVSVEGLPARVWFIGMEESLDLANCIIAERIVRKD